jgi:Type II restriction endonuclease EcoO109I
MVEETSDGLVANLLEQLPRSGIVPAVAATLGVSRAKADAIVQAFDDYVARPFEANLRKLRGRDLAKRNPFIYTVRSVETVDEWVDRVLTDKETSAIEGHIGTFLEQVARLVSDGIKPGSGVDLVDDAGVAHLFAIQMSANTKNAGSRRSDIDALKRAARPLRANRQRVTLNIAILQGQKKTRPDGSDQAVTVLSSEDFWHLVSEIPDFGRRLLQASTLLGWLIKTRSSDEIERIRSEALALYADEDGRLNLDAVAGLGTPPDRPAIDDGLLDL